MISNDHPVVVQDGEKSRKRVRNKSKREQEKENRYRQTRPPVLLKCTHRKDAGSFKCGSIRGKDAMQFAKAFYLTKNKIQQDSFLLTYTSTKNPTRRMENSSAKRAVSINYFIRKANNKISRVCQTAFCGILGIKRDRIVRVCKNHLSTRLPPIERRGGDRIGSKNHTKKDAVIQFIQKFKTIEIHYCRSKLARRQYLPSELNINKMYQQFMRQSPEGTNVTQSFFRNVFNLNFNIGFKTPSADLCSICIMLAEQLKIEKDPQKKQYQLMVDRLVHKRRAQAFYHLLQEQKDDLITISFDCQKNMVLPKVADQAAYYSRQLYMFNFGVVVGSSKSPLTTENVFLYSWTENQYSKGSYHIASAVHHRLQHLNLTNKKRVRLVADGCGGQNKNTIMLGMCSYWLLKESPASVTSLEIIFPVAGHSFIPPDRVFAKIEKEVRNRQTIIKPEEYLEIYKSHATVICLGSDACPVRDWKAQAANVIRPPGQWHFRFNDCKRFILTKPHGKLLVRGEAAYKSDLGAGKSITKRGKSITQINPSIVEPGVQISDAKITDVKHLLKHHFGENWSEMEDLVFYKNIVNSNSTACSIEEEDPICETQEEDVGLRI